MDRGSQLVQVLSCVLSRLVAVNDALPPEKQCITKFHALRPPGIGVRDYLDRIHKYSGCSPECFVLALVYIDRLIQRNSILLCSLNIHRIIITSLMLAAKFFDDQYFNNAFYAKVGGVPCVEMNSLELEFLFSINFGLQVPTEVYEKYNCELVHHVNKPSIPCECPKVFSSRGVTFALPPLPVRLPAPDGPCLGYDPTGVRRYRNTEVFIDDCFTPDGRVVPFATYAPALAGGGSGAGSAMAEGEGDTPM